MSIVAQICRMNDAAKTGGSAGIDRIYLSSAEIWSVLDEWPWLKHYRYLQVDGVWIHWNGR